ncbi:hypothetical protein [Embleya sp. NPDC005971]|uniref:hypothetical protein n=1 Tax=Embleya sp. NPDC005971 TaxID=3156724 RepID=UPI0033FEB7DB
MSSEPLQAPQNPEDLYLYADPDDPVPAHRPINQGDCFEGVRLSNGPLIDRAMLVAHPCAMRKGNELRPELVVAEISPYPGISATKWPNGHYDVMPLPAFTGTSISTAVYLHRLNSVKSEDLLVAKRIAALTNYGQVVFLQRWIHHLSRLTVKIDEIMGQIRPVYSEVDMQEDWCEAALSVETSTDESYEAILHEASTSFQDFLGDPRKDDSRRNLMKEESGLVLVRQQVALERFRRYGR